jgi:hypothetical protein
MAIKMRILGAMAVGFALCGCASTANVKPAALAAQSDPNCVTETGSRLAPAETGSRAPTRGCRLPGRTITGEDISRTGQLDLGNALSQLDPSITVHH